MKFVIDRKRLETEFDFLRVALPRGMQKDAPTINWMTISVDKDGTLTLIAADGRRQLTSHLPLDGPFVAGSVATLPFGIDQLVRLLADERITLQSVGHRLHVEWTDGECTFVRSMDDRLPKVGDETPQSTVVIKASALRELLRKVEYAFPYNHDPRVSGVLVECGEQLRVVATDGAALGIVTSDVKSQWPGRFVLSVLACTQIQGLLRHNSADEIKLEFGEFIQATAGHRSAVMRMAPEKFPPWERILFTPSLRADFPRDIAIESLKRAPTELRVQLLLKAGEATLKTDESVESFGADYDGDPVAFTFKKPLLLSALQSIDGARVEFLGTNEKSQVLFRPLNQSTEQHVLMPMRG